jgi:hypothetical protein
VHDNAQLAVVSVSLVRVEVRYLGYGQQGKKDEAHDRDRREDAVPGAAAAEICLQCCQSMTLTVPILQKNLLIWTLRARRGCI